MDSLDILEFGDEEESWKLLTDELELSGIEEIENFDEGINLEDILLDKDIRLNKNLDCQCFETTETDFHKALPPKNINIPSKDADPEAGPSRLENEPEAVIEPTQIPKRKTRTSGNKRVRAAAESVKGPVTITLSDDDDEDDVVVSQKLDYITARHLLLIQQGKDNSKKNELDGDRNKQKLASGPRLGLTKPYRPVELLKDAEKEVVSTISLSPESIEIADKLKHLDEKLVEIIKNEMMDNTKVVTWDDISGLEYPKTIIKETVIMPQLRPDLFTGLRRPAKGILLFGPPGTGKTLIGKCIASQSKSTFFSISSSTLTSKWIGEGEKLVRALFAVAAAYQPSVIFIDEIDSILCQRSEQEHEASRRMKTEFLIRLDGATTSDEDRVLIVGATNRPQELDEAARRRLVKRLYIPLPDEKARNDMLTRLLSKVTHDLSPEELGELSKSTEGYSGADMHSLCQEAAMGPIRDIPIQDLQHISEGAVRSVNHGDFQMALKRVKSSVNQNELDAYVKWDTMFGCG